MLCTKNDADDETKRTFCEKLQSRTCKRPSHAILIGLGDMNAYVGNASLDRVMGKHKLSAMNKKGELLVDFCGEHLVIGGTLGPHKNIHKIIWNSPYGGDKNQIP